MENKLSGHIIYSGPSEFDGATVICVAVTESKNRKTGSMMQTYILRADMDPVEASRLGADISVCGDCPHRGKANPNARGWALDRACYVNLAHGPSAVYRAYTAGKYPVVHRADDITSIGRGHMVRVGTYGDPAAVPNRVWDALLRDARGMTGYTHARTRDTHKRLMLSVDTVHEARDAWSAGRRTFRVIPITEWRSLGVKALQKGEVLCPASKEAGRKVQCQTCGLCDGARQGKSVAVVAHGLGRKHVKGCERETG